MKIEELDLSVRAYNCLKKAGIDTVEQFKERDVEEILRIRNLGKRSYEEFMEKIKNMCSDECREEKRTLNIPCSIGDTVWCIRNYKGHRIPQQGIVTDMYFKPDMELCIVVKFIGRGKFGKDIFATREDAENYLKGAKP